GFARCEEALPQGQIACELKSVNHRFLEMSLRLPEDLRSAEAQIRAALSNSVRRGKVEVSFQFRTAASGARLEVDPEVLGSVLQAAHQIAAQAGGGESRIDVIDVLRWPGVLREAARDDAAIVTAALALLERTLGELARFRDSEGARLRGAGGAGRGVGDA